jgi:peptidoglycan/xylan/chitin deacetylase (PgdA/CDA1 family)
VRALRRVVGQGVKAAAAAADRVRPPRPGIVVLLYHRVGGASALEIDLPREAFAAQMELVAATSRVLRLGEALAELASPAGPPAGRPGVVITFDDGTADFADVALPVLERHGLPVTLYVATAFVDEGRHLPHHGTPLSWGALRDACASGLVDVGSHSHSHALFDRLPERAARDDLDRSVDLLSSRLGRAPLDFAYPKAVAPAAATERLVAERFRSAAVAGTRANRHGRTDPYRLARSPIQRSDATRWFRRKLEGGMALEDTLRRGANRYRYARSVT